MEYNQFVAVMDAIAKKFGDINSFADMKFYLIDGSSIEGTWRWLKDAKTSHGIIVISDKFLIPVSNILAVGLSAGLNEAP